LLGTGYDPFLRREPRSNNRTPLLRCNARTNDALHPPGCSRAADSRSAPMTDGTAIDVHFFFSIRIKARVIAPFSLPPTTFYRSANAQAGEDSAVPIVVLLVTSVFRASAGMTPFFEGVPSERARLQFGVNGWERCCGQSGAFVRSTRSSPYSRFFLLADRGVEWTRVVTGRAANHCCDLFFSRQSNVSVSGVLFPRQGSSTEMTLYQNGSDSDGDVWRTRSLFFVVQLHGADG